MVQNKTLTKVEAITLMEQGFKLTHEYFTFDEWITYGRRGMILTEEGYLHRSVEFWKDRSKAFDTGWSIFKENK